MPSIPLSAQAKQAMQDISQLPGFSLDSIADALDSQAFHHLRELAGAGSKERRTAVPAPAAHDYDARFGAELDKTRRDIALDAAERPHHVPASDRRQLLRIHDVMRKTRDGTNDFRIAIFGTPKSFSSAPLLMKDMQVPKVHKGHYIIVRTLALPVLLDCLVFVIEDQDGRAETLNLYDYPLHGLRTGEDLDAFFPPGSIFLIREPKFQPARDGAPVHIRVDSPTDVEVLKLNAPILAKVSWATASPNKSSVASSDYRKIGNEYVKQGLDLHAIKAYGEGLAVTEDKKECLILALNRAQASLRIHNFASAYRDTSIVLAYLDMGVEGPPRAKTKATLRRAKALEGMRLIDSAMPLYQQLWDDEEDEEAGAGLTRLDEMIAERDEGDIAWECMPPEDPHYSHGDFVGPIRIAKMPKREGGRGMITTQDVAAGDVLLVEKAFAVGEWPNRGIAIGYDLRTEAEMQPSRFQLVSAITTRLMDDPSVMPALNSLYGGPSFPASGSFSIDPLGSRYVSEFGAAPANADMERIEAICCRNGFNLHPRTVDKDKDDQLGNSSSGLFLVGSGFNSSCLPNASWVCYDDILAVRARTAIKKGKEVYIAYSPVDDNFDTRQDILKVHFPNGCPCAYCVDERRETDEIVDQRDALYDEFGLISGEVQTQAHAPAIVAKLLPLIKRIEATYSPTRGPVRPRLVMAYVALSQLTDLTKAKPVRALSTPYDLKALEASGAVIEISDDEVKVIAGPICHPDIAKCTLVDIAHRSARLRTPEGDREALKWLKAAFAMCRIIYSDQFHEFWRRHAKEVEEFALERFEEKLRAATKRV
ncbi:hypothetical protein JCM10450v2_006415 [Rhodotorula kratochvilovae]